MSAWIQLERRRRWFLQYSRKDCSLVINTFNQYNTFNNEILEKYLQLWKSSGRARIEPWITRLEVGRLDHCTTGIALKQQDLKLFIVSIGFTSLIIMVQIKEMGHQNVFFYPVDSRTVRIYHIQSIFLANLSIIA